VKGGLYLVLKEKRNGLLKGRGRKGPKILIQAFGLALPTAHYLLVRKAKKRNWGTREGGTEEKGELSGEVLYRPGPSVGPKHASFPPLTVKEEWKFRGRGVKVQCEKRGGTRNYHENA